MYSKNIYSADWGFDKSSYGLDFYHFSYNGNPVIYGMGWGGQFFRIIRSLNTVIVINENISATTAVK